MTCINSDHGHTHDGECHCIVLCRNPDCLREYGHDGDCDECLGRELGELAEEEAFERLCAAHRCFWCHGLGGLLDGKPAHPNFQAEVCPVCLGSGGLLPKPGLARQRVIVPPAPSTIPASTWRDEDPTCDDVLPALRSAS